MTTDKTVPATMKKGKSFFKTWLKCTCWIFAIFCLLGFLSASGRGLAWAIGGGIILAPIKGLILAAIIWAFRKSDKPAQPSKKAGPDTDPTRDILNDSPAPPNTPDEPNLTQTTDSSRSNKFAVILISIVTPIIILIITIVFALTSNKDPKNSQDSGNLQIQTSDRQIIQTRKNSEQIINSEPTLTQVSKEYYSDQAHPQLSSIRSFKLFKLRGEIVQYKSDTIQSRMPTSFKDDELTYCITSADKGIMIGNVASVSVDVYKDESTVTLVETTPSGNVNTLVISSKWDSDEGGFNCTYNRNSWILRPSLNNGTGIKLVSNFNGIAKPFD